VTRLYTSAARDYDRRLIEATRLLLQTLSGALQPWWEDPAIGWDELEALEDCPLRVALSNLGRATARFFEGDIGDDDDGQADNCAILIGATGQFAAEFTRLLMIVRAARGRLGSDR
jgi:hypothetical protein